MAELSTCAQRFDSSPTNGRNRRNVVLRKQPHYSPLSKQQQTFIASVGAALQNASSPVQLVIGGLAFMRILRSERR